MKGIDPLNVEFAISKIEDGFVFERFAKEYLSHVIGSKYFIPVGGIKDKGIDGFSQIFENKYNEKDIYQFSIEKEFKHKIDNTIAKLIKNKIYFDRITYATNQKIHNKETICDEMYEKYGKIIIVYDSSWFGININKNGSTIRTYNTFVESYLHEFNRPGKTYSLSNLVDDPRLYVFLSQQIDSNNSKTELSSVLCDTLIMYVLEGTDPDKKILKNKEQIIEDISRLIKFEPKVIIDNIDNRLKVLTTKPRKVRYHSKEKGYCLPYGTRVSIRERNIKDTKEYERFKLETESMLKHNLKDVGIVTNKIEELLENVFHNIFYSQGLEFANFIRTSGSEDIVMKELPNIISKVVDESTVIPKNKIKIKYSLLTTIREIIYNGTIIQKKYLRNLSNTYSVLFLVQCEPKVTTYFNSLASKLSVFVGTSIIIPALSEFYLTEQNKRFWNLLKGAKSLGVHLVINDVILNELIDHFVFIIHRYEDLYQDNEDLYINVPDCTPYIDEIMLRAYFYSKRRKQVHDFYTFINNFINPRLTNTRQQIVILLKNLFGIEYKTEIELGIKIDESIIESVTEKLVETKGNIKTAKRDAKTMLSVYKLREKNNELNSSSIFGYKTWWLSTDTLTYKTIEKLFPHKHKVSCYMRPDFLYNYISLSPKKEDVEVLFRNIFPSILGVNLSYHIPGEISQTLNQYIKEYYKTTPHRVESIICEITEELKTNPELYDKNKFRAHIKAMFKK